MPESFQHRLSQRAPLVGSFVKTAAPQVVEIAAIAGLDFVVLDAEHAPFSPADIDHCVLAGRAAAIPVLVRVPDHVGPWIQQALDVGSDGVMVPHVSSVNIAEHVVRSARYINGARGYSNSPRVGRYGTASMADMIEAEDQRAAIIVQIEDRGGMENFVEIAAVPGVDALFIGVADLAAAFQAEGPSDPRMIDIIGKVTSFSAEQGRPCGGFFPQAIDNLPHGMSFCIVGSDQSFLRTGWRAALRAIRHLDQP